MPFFDLQEKTFPFSGEDFDYTIIGAGAAGIMMAVELSKRNKRVLLIESGHFKKDAERQAFNEVIQMGKELKNASWGRCRAIGGTTLMWGGQSLPFSRMDFTKRPWVENSGWPITFDDLEPYYPMANDFMGVDKLDYHRDMFETFSIHPPEFSSSIDFHYSKWAPQPNFKKKYFSVLKRDVVVLYNAMVVSIDINTNGKAEYVQVSNYNKSRTTIRINHLFIAAGGIETNRILLLNRGHDGKSIGDHSGWLGRCFMDHPCIATGMIVPKDPWKIQKLFNTNIHRLRKFSKRLSLSSEYQETQQLTNASASIMFSYPSEGFNPYQEIMSLRNKRIPRFGHAVKVFSFLFRAATALLVNRFVYKHRATAQLLMMLEQEPLFDSYISLSEEKDLLGMPKASLHWKISKRTWDSVVVLSDLIREEFKKLDLGEYIPYSHIQQNQENWQDYLSDVNHHMGGTRMSHHSEDGVVDKNLRIWGYDNIFVLSSSVFPTGSHSNPTLTILALGQKWIHENVR